MSMRKYFHINANLINRISVFLSFQYFIFLAI